MADTARTTAPFQRPEDLEQVPGIGPDLVHRAAARQITVRGD
jgi:DNA uptake protein ComE-like DNA-binding protein